MITWHDGPAGSTAALFMRGMCVARAHATSAGWRIELLGGAVSGPASSLGDAKRQALATLADELHALEIELRSALVTRA